MVAASRKTESLRPAVAREFEARSELASPPLALATDGDRAKDSPARRLQQRLRGSLEADGERGRWTPRATLLFILATCGGFWALIAVALQSVLH